MMNKEQHLLLKLSEECGEVQKVCSKAMLFGLDDKHPDKGTTNREMLQAELNDIMASIDMLNRVGFEFKKNPEAIEAKKRKVLHYYKYSQEQSCTE